MMKRKEPNVFKFLNSQDVCEYLESINYQFSALESAVIVYHSHKKSLAEKNDAWRTIIETMPDCEIPATDEEPCEPSLHALLKRCIEQNMENEKLFFDPYPAFYTYSYQNPLSMEWEKSPTIFNDLSALLKCAKESYTEVVEHYGEPNETRTKHFVKNFSVHKQSVPDDDGLADVWHADFYKGKITECCASFQEYISDRLSVVPIDIPTPFCCGDILTLQQSDYHHGKEFVLYCMPNWTKNDFVRNGIDYEKEIANPQSLIDLDYGKFKLGAYGYFVDDNGEIYHQHPGPYFDFEYCRKPLANEQKVLKPISDYLKGGKGLEYLLQGYLSELEICKIKRRTEYAGLQPTEEE